MARDWINTRPRISACGARRGRAPAGGAAPGVFREWLGDELLQGIFPPFTPSAAPA